MSDCWAEGHTVPGYPTWQMKICLDLNPDYNTMICTSGNSLAWETAARLDEINIMTYPPSGTPSLIEASCSSTVSNLDTVTGTKFKNTRIGIEPATMATTTKVGVKNDANTVASYFSTSPHNYTKFSSGGGIDVHDYPGWVAKA